MYINYDHETFIKTEIIYACEKIHFEEIEIKSVATL